MSEVDHGPIELLPGYVQNQLPQSTFDAVVTRIAIATREPDGRVILESFIESQKAPAYEGSQKAEAPKPIEEYPKGTEPLTRVKQQIVIELFLAITREDRSQRNHCRLNPEQPRHRKYKERSRPNAIIRGNINKNRPPNQGTP